MTGIDTLAATLGQGLDAAEQRARDTAATVTALGLTPDLPLSVVLVQAVVARDRRLLDLLLAEKHTTCEDSWYSCSAADVQTGDRDGEQDCNCGRDARVAAYLAVLAEAYEEST